MSEVSDVVRRVLDERLSTADVLAAEDGAWVGRDATWDVLESLGLTLLGVPEERGGSGGDLVDACEIVEEATRHCAPLPLAETGLLAGYALASAGLDVPPGPLAVAGLHPRDRLTAASEGRTWRISGTAFRVPWATTCSRIVAVAPLPGGETGVALLDRHSLHVEPGTNVAGEPRDDVGLDASNAVEARGAGTSGLLDGLWLRGTLARAVQLSAALQAVQDQTVAYANERQQFGRSIGRFQAVAQAIATMAADVALARVSVEMAVDSIVAGQPQELEVAIAKVMCGRAARQVTAVAHQVHGAIGVTREHPLQLLTRRLWAWQDEFGSERRWSEVLGRRLREGNEDLWTLVSSTSPRTGPALVGGPA